MQWSAGAIPPFGLESKNPGFPHLLRIQIHDILAARFDDRSVPGVQSMPAESATKPKSASKPKSAPKVAPKAPKGTPAKSVPKTGPKPKFPPAVSSLPSDPESNGNLGPAAVELLASPPVGKSGPATSRAISEAARLLRMAADATRLGILTRIADEEITVGELSRRAGMTQPALSHHLALMRHAGIVRADRRGKNNIYCLTDSGRRVLSAASVLLS
jgi:DNA-binding transcriptional ArsR family regulator